MRYIHPFPARMAPELVLSKVKAQRKGKRILDPMSGSGVVLAQAAKHGLEPIGYDLDPLARMISRVCSTRVNEKLAQETLNKLITKCVKDAEKDRKVSLSWIDSDEETSLFIKFWFYRKQTKQLRLLSYYLVEKPITTNQKVLNILKVALSRLIITKDPKASLARDTAHSRPHKTIDKNTFDIFSELQASLNHVLVSLDSDSIKVNSKTYLGDARNMTRIESGSIDAVITSPPYLNAIDYMRGHRLSLVWMGYKLDELRDIRGVSIGVDKIYLGDYDEVFSNLLGRLKLKSLNDRNQKILNRYFNDLVLQLSETHRVLKKGATATYIIGNSNINGKYIRNSELLKEAGLLAGLIVGDEFRRKIPNNRRYLPISVKKDNALAGRMKSEHIIEFCK